LGESHKDEKQEIICCTKKLSPFWSDLFMALADIAAQMSEQLLAVSNGITTNSMQFYNVVTNQQITDVIENPSDPSEVIGSIGVTAAALRGAQPPIQPPVAGS